jgi:hypothetical protein
MLPSEGISSIERNAMLAMPLLFWNIIIAAIIPMIEYTKPITNAHLGFFSSQLLLRIFSSMLESQKHHI